MGKCEWSGSSGVVCGEEASDRVAFNDVELFLCHHHFTVATLRERKPWRRAGYFPHPQDMASLDRMALRALSQ